jgi:branched-chain amino acid transport system permease protein
VAVPPELVAALDPRSYARRTYVGAVAVAGLSVVPLGATAPQLSQLTWALFLVMFAVSWDLVSGYTGQISFGHTFFFGVGGYTTVVLNVQHGVSPIVGIPLGALLAAVGGVLIGVPALRVRGPYLALLTMAAPLILLGVIVGFSDELPYLAPEGLGGTAGFVTPSDPLVGTAAAAVVTVDSFAMKILIEYYVVLAMLAVVLTGCYAVTGPLMGEVLTAIREDPQAVQAVGIDHVKFKVFAFVFSGFVGGLAGGAFVHTSAGNPVDPLQLVFLDLAIEIIIMAVLGGLGTITGAVLGALFFATASLFVGAIDVGIPGTAMTLSDTMPAPLFLAAILVLRYRPDGFLGWLGTLGASRDRQRPESTDDLSRPDDEQPAGDVFEELFGPPQE